MVQQSDNLPPEVESCSLEIVTLKHLQDKTYILKNISSHSKYTLIRVKKEKEYEL
jgi:hypothetical protein